MIWTLVVIILLGQTARSSCPSRCVCSHRTIDCSSSGLSGIPNDLPSELPFFDTETRNSFLPDVTSTVTILNLANNELKGLPTPLLSKNLPNVQSIDLTNNKIKEVSRVQSIVLSKRLFYFKLSSNPIRNLGYNADKVLYSQSISHLDLSDCAISSVTSPVSLMYLTNLTHLDLSGNPLVVVDNLSSSSLAYLDISGGLLGLNDKGIREQVFINLPKLQFLNISMNAHLTTIPSAEVLSFSLRNLDASYCAFDKIALRSFPSLQKAIFRGNLIKTLQNNMLSGNSHLQNLDVSENVIQNIEPHAFVGGDRLKLLDLSSNYLSNINWKMFSQTPHLNVLNVSRNLITYIDEIPLHSLTNLDASKCEITKLYPKFLSKATGLKFLNLSHNYIEQLPTRLTGPKLLVLDLSFCRIYNLEEESFQGLSSVTCLNLMGNYLTGPLEKNLFDHLVNIDELNLLNNPWHCDCDDPEFKHLWNYLSSTSMKTDHLNELKCQSPKQYNGISWNKSCFETLKIYEGKKHQNKGWFSFLVPFLTICILLATMIVIRQAYGSHGSESQQNSPSQQASEFVPRIAPHIFDDEFERGVQLSANESTQRSQIRELSKLPSYEEALLLPNPQNRQDLKIIVNKYEESGRFATYVSQVLTNQSDCSNLDDSSNNPSTSRE